MTVDSVGGVWTYALDLIHALPSIEFALATMGAPLSASQTEQVRALPNVSLFASDYRLEWMDEPWDDVDRAGDWLLQIADEFSPDLVHLNGYAHAALPWDLPVLVVAHSCVLSWWRAVKRDNAPARFDEYRRRVSDGLQAATLVVAPTAAMLASLRENYAVEFKGCVIRNGRDHAGFSPSIKQPKIFAAGRVWDEAKNLEMLEVIAPQVSWPIAVAGEMAHPNGNEIAFAFLHSLGLLTPGELARHLASTAIYVAPGYYEPFGLAILEAGLSGCALVLGDLRSLRELWDGAAVFVAPDDPEALARTLQTLISNAMRREEFGLRARKRALAFPISKMAQGYRRVYGELASPDTGVAARPVLSAFARPRATAGATTSDA